MLSAQTIVVIEELLQEELCDVQGTLMLYEHQLTLEPKYRKVPDEQMGETVIKNLRLRAIHLATAIEEFRENTYGRPKNI